MKLRTLTGAGVAVALAIGLAAFGRAGAGEAGGLAFGDAAPKADVSMMGVDGKTYSLESVAGKKGTLVLFSCNACPWVKAWEGRISEICNQAQKDGFGVVVINSNDPEMVPEDGFAEMQKRAKARGFEFPYVVDATSEVAGAFGATRTPEVFLFDAKGKLVYHGAIDDNAHQPDAVKATYLKDALSAVMAGKDVERKSTKALGCSIKPRDS